jgi:metallo-beta-lactamase class B
LLTTVTVLFAGSAARVYGQAPAPTQSAQPRRGQFTIKPFKVIGNIYSVGLSNNTSYLVTTPQGHILIDATLAKAVPDVRKNIEDLGFKISDIKILLSTHAHADHVGGLAEFKELTGAKVMTMSKDAEAVAAGREDPATAEVAMMAEDSDTVASGDKENSRTGEPQWKPVRPDRILHDGDKVQLGGTTLVANLTAGHTRGCTSWSTVAEENGKKYNVVLVCSIRMNTGVPLLNNAKYPNVAADHAAGIKKLRSIPADIWMVSHSYMFGMNEKLERAAPGASSPFYDPDGYKAYLDQNEKALQDQLEKERAGGGAFDGRVPQAAICPEDGRTCY